MSFRAVDSCVTAARSPADEGSMRVARMPLAVLSILAITTATPAGCMYGQGDGTIDTTVQELNANEHTAFDYFLGKGLTAIQAAAILGNLMQESNVDPTAVQPGGPGRGIAQWSVGGRWDHDAGDNVVAYAAAHGASAWSLQLQLDFIWYELNTYSWYGLAALRSSTTVSAATIAFETRFEGCGSCNESQRISYANQVLAAWGGDAAAWGGQFVSQSFPYASAGAVSIPAGGTARISITMRNSGSHAWDSRTCIGTTMPCDRTSPFAGSDWPSANRPACVPAGATVAHGDSHTFTWTMHAPAATGRYDEHWGMVEEGVSWFSAAGQAGPPDDQLEGIFTVTVAPTPPPPPPPPSDAGVSDASIVEAGSDSGVVSGSDSGLSRDAAGPRDVTGDASDPGRRDVASDRAGDGGTGMAMGGCNAAGARGLGGGSTLLAVAMALALASARRRRPEDR